jgi:hypothetical protein
VKKYVAPTMDFVELRSEEKISVCSKGECVYNVDGIVCGRGYWGTYGPS